MKCRLSLGGCTSFEKNNFAKKSVRFLKICVALPELLFGTSELFGRNNSFTEKQYTRTPKQTQGAEGSQKTPQQNTALWRSASDERPDDAKRFVVVDFLHSWPSHPICWLTLSRRWKAFCDQVRLSLQPQQFLIQSARRMGRCSIRHPDPEEHKNKLEKYRPRIEGARNVSTAQPRNTLKLPKPT